MKRILTVFTGLFIFVAQTEATHRFGNNASNLTSGILPNERLDPSSVTLAGPIPNGTFSSFLDNTASTQTKIGPLNVRDKMIVGSATGSVKAQIILGNGTEADVGNPATVKIMGSTGTTTSSLMLDGVKDGSGNNLRDSAFWMINNASTVSFHTRLPAGVTPLIQLTTAVQVNGNMQVSGNFSAAVKNFQIPNPADPARWLVHSVVESDKYGLVYDGEAQLSGGAVTIHLPSYFEAVCDAEGRRVQLTPLDGYSPLYVDGPVANGQLTVRTAAGGNSSQKFFWQISGKRGDPYIKSIGDLVVEPLISEADIDLGAESKKSGFGMADRKTKENAIRRMRSKYQGYESEALEIEIKK